MADLRDEYGNPVQHTDEHGNPVQLTDEHGNPVHLTGLATKHDTTVGTGVFTGGAPGADAGGEYLAAVGVVSTEGVHGTTGALATEPSPATYGTGTGTGLGGDRTGASQPLGQHLSQEGVITAEHRSGSSSSSSSEDDGQGGRVKKKKGLGTKIKEKLTGGKHRDDQHHHRQTTTATCHATTITTTTMASHEHEKKSLMEKIKDKLPGHHNTTN